jgi:iron complex outermembrane receptor protein
MLDVELGYEYASEKFSLSANIYLMEYWDMLIETGKLTDVGYAIKENVPRSWRRGVELAAIWAPLEWMTVGGNLTLSQNKIKSFTAYYEMYDNMDWWNYLGQKEVLFENSDILMSPSVVGSASLSFRPFAYMPGSLNSTYLSLNGKYVGKQYYDNTSSDERMIPSYFTADLAAGYEVPLLRRDRQNDLDRCPSLSFSLHVNNLFNNLYYADAWVWRAYFQESDSWYSETGVFPQAPANFMLKVAINF